MTAQDLKNAILQLATQGKLVPQDPADEPASNLLRYISMEKLKQIQSGMSIDKRHAPTSITEADILYDIPDTWAWIRFGDLVHFESGRTPQRQNMAYWKVPSIPWVSIADMNADGVTAESKEQISQIAFKECFSESIVPAGTLIMSFKLTIGKVSILGMDATHNEAIISIYPFAHNTVKETIKQYLFRVLPLIAAGGNYKHAVKGKTLNATSITNLMIPLPPLAEQNRIVAKIEELLPYIEEYDAAEKRLTALDMKFPDQLRKSVLQQAIMGKLTERNSADESASELLKRIRAEKARLAKEGKLKKEKPLPPITESEIPFDIPDGWEWAYLDDLVIIRGGKRMPKGRQLITSPTDHIYVRVTDMQSGTILDSDLHYVPDDVYPLIQRYIIEKSDIYLVIVGSTIGKTGLVPEMFDRMNLTENAVRLTPIIIYKEFLYLVLDSAPIQQQFSEKIKQEGQPKLAITRLRSSIIPLPPLAEQKRIVERVEELLAACGQLR